jgi:hypothetical protein
MKAGLFKICTEKENEKVVQAFQCVHPKQKQ